MFLLKSKSTNSISNDNISSSLIKLSLVALSSTLLEKYSNMNLSVESVDSLDSQERRDSAISDFTVNDSRDVLPLEKAYTAGNYTHGVALRQTSIDENFNGAGAIKEGCDSFFARFNSKLKSFGERIYLVNVDDLIELLNYYYGFDNQLDTNMFPYLHGLTNSKKRIFFNDDYVNNESESFNFEKHSDLDVEHYPTTKQLHLMFLNSQDTSDCRLNNSIPFEEFVDLVRDFDDTDDLNNRNFKDQLYLYGKLSHFVIYNNNNNLGVNLNKALELKTSRNIYVVNFNNRHWNLIPPHYTSDSNFSQIHQLPINSINNTVFNCLFLKWEQNLLWKFNSMKWFNRNICVGNLIDYNYLANVNHNFKVIINCTEHSSIPKHVVSYVEFPSSGYLHFDQINLTDLMNYLNLLKTIKALHDSNQQVFVFSFDGFTGVTLLTLSIGLILSDKTLEELILDIHVSERMKLYYFKSDLNFLKRFEKFIKYAKHHEGPIKFINYNDLKPVRSTKSYDWFNYTMDNNFPCCILKNIYLGSLNHANSTTVLGSMKFTRIVSIGEKPCWLLIEGHKPIYLYKDHQGIVNIYEIPINNEKMPRLKTAVYIENIKDDGKDHVLPLFTKVPQHIQDAYLLKPDVRGRCFYHCKIGVSRLASLVIASLMKHEKLSMIESYMITRINRFNIIIQPNLKIFYDLYLYESQLNLARRAPREYSWYHMCYEIYKLNRNYIA